MNVSGSAVPFVNTEMRLLNFQTYGQSSSGVAISLFSTWGFFPPMSSSKTCKMVLTFIAVHDGAKLTDLNGHLYPAFILSCSVLITLPWSQPMT